MSEDQMLKCLIALVLGYLVARMVIGNGFSIGFVKPPPRRAVSLKQAAEFGVVPVSDCQWEKCEKVTIDGKKGNELSTDSGMRNWAGAMAGQGEMCAVQRIDYTGMDFYGFATGGKEEGCWP